jgi:hypothetical protein
MHEKSKYRFLIIIIPTILWGIVYYLIYSYWNDELPGIGSIQESEVLLPLWLIYLFLGIGYLFSIIIGYVVVYKENF